MIEDTSKELLSLFLWSFVPSFLTNIVLNQYYRLRYNSEASRPRKGSEKYRKHYLVAYTSVMMCYFAYCLGQAIYDLPENYYTKIGIHRMKADIQLKPRFRSLVMQLHPDKAPNADPEKFLEIKQIYEVLENNEMRISYEAFGEAALNSATKSSKRNKNSRITLKDLFEASLMNWIVYYVGSSLVLLLMSIILRKSGIYWRLTGVLLCAASELYVMTRPRIAVDLDLKAASFGIFPQFTVHEKLIIMKNIVVNLSMLFTQLLSISEEPVKTLMEEMTQSSKDIHKMVSGPLSELADDQISEISELIEKNELFGARLKTSLGKFTSQQLQGN